MDNKNIKQQQLIGQVENEYNEYLSALEGKSVNEIICESERTSFYANLVFYLREKQLDDKKLKCFNQDNILEKAYKTYLKNDFNYLDIMKNFNRLVNEMAKEQQEQM